MDTIGMARYSRQTLFRPIGVAGQTRLGSAKVAIVGMGALGTVISTQLVRAGVGYVRMIDRDIVELSNLQRQSLYDESDALDGMPKAIAASTKLRCANREVTIEPHVTDVTWRNAETLLSDVDVIVDGTDNFQIRYLINDVSVKHRIPWAYGGAVSSYGTTAFIRPGETPCLVCLFGELATGGHDTCDTVGVIGAIASMVASLQVTEVLKYLTGNEHALQSGITHLDVWNNEFGTIAFPTKKADCPCCSKRHFKSLEARREALTVSLCGRQTIQVKSEHAVHLSLANIGERLKRVGRVHHNEHLLRFTTEDLQLTLFADGRALIHGIDDEVTARSIYAKYVGM